MDKLIEALTILRKYGNPTFPTYCEHDIMYFTIEPSEVSQSDLEKLEDLHVYTDEYEDCFYSHWYGSA